MQRCLKLASEELIRLHPAHVLRHVLLVRLQRAAANLQQLEIATILEEKLDKLSSAVKHRSRKMQAALSFLRSDLTPENIKNCLSEFLAANPFPNLAFPLQPVGNETINETFARTISMHGRSREATTQLKSDIQDWNQHKEEFLNFMRDFSVTVSKMVAPGNPLRPKILAAGWEAFSNQYFKHAGAALPYDQWGVSGDSAPEDFELFFCIFFAA